MNRINRVTSILIQLQSKKIIPAKEIAQRFNISLRTVYRWDEGRGAVRRRQGQRPSGAGRAAGTSRQ